VILEASGAVAVVWRDGPAGFEFLVLHRAAPPDFDGDWSVFDGDWAWTPPSGVRDPGEATEECARRELREESGLDVADLVPIPLGDGRWPAFLVQVNEYAEVTLSEEHDAFRWVTAEVASSLCKPGRIGAQFVAAAKLLSTKA
jgi:8-oxo-dGTP pyrophosphatase MutT (NUDIX family)